MKWYHGAAGVATVGVMLTLVSGDLFVFAVTLLTAATAGYGWQRNRLTGGA